jgi:large subunit ribosomal protein L35
MLFLRRLQLTGAARSLVRANATVAATAADVSSASASTTAASPPLESASKPFSTQPAEVQSASDSKSAVTPATDTGKPSTRKLAQKKPGLRTRRPYISLESPREWNRPISHGLLPAYDFALKLIHEDAQAVQTEARELRMRLEKGEVPAERREAEEKRLNVLEVMGKVNLPDVRWNAANGMGTSCGAFWSCDL